VKVGEAAALTRGTLPGRAKATREVNLSFRVAGPLISFPVNVGDEVEQGDLLAQIDPRDFEVRVRSVEGQLARARSELEAMRIARPEDVTRAQAKVRSAEADATLAAQNLKRLQGIQAEDPGAIAQTMIDQAVAAKGASDAAVTNALEELQIANVGARPEDIAAKESEIASLEASVDARQDKLDYTYLRAPFPGTIVATYVENFEDVQAKEVIMSLQSVDTIEIVINVPERVLALTQSREGLELAATFPAAPGSEFPLWLKEIAAESDPRTQTFAVTFAMHQPDELNILPGMTAEVWARQVMENLSQEDQSFLVPATAVFVSEAGDPAVWVLENDQTARLRTVEVGQLVAPDRIQVLDGVVAGERIAIAAVSQIRDGMTVRLMAEN
jgi:RND family efflux transporter MFP subunit